MKFAVTLFAIAFMLSGCASLGMAEKTGDVTVHSAQETADVRQLLLGKWYGEKRLDDGTEQKWIVTRAADGTYVIQFRLTNSDGTVDQWKEVGVWGVRKPIYFTAMRGFVEGNQIQPADTTRPALYDAYRIVDVASDHFTYHSYTSGNIFTVKRVGADFEF